MHSFHSNPLSLQPGTSDIDRYGNFGMDFGPSQIKWMILGISVLLMYDVVSDVVSIRPLPLFLARE